MQILELAANTGVRCHIVHSSIAAGNRIARHYRDRGARISVESCVHYFIFNDQDAIRQGAFLKLNPPIRAESERRELWQTWPTASSIWYRLTTWAWPLSRKSGPDMANNGSGIPGLETLLPAFYTGAVRGHFHSPTLVAQIAAKMLPGISASIRARVRSRRVPTPTSPCSVRRSASLQRTGWLRT